MRCFLWLFDATQVDGLGEAGMANLAVGENDEVAAYRHPRDGRLLLQELHPALRGREAPHAALALGWRRRGMTTMQRSSDPARTIRMGDSWPVMRKRTLPWPRAFSASTT